MQEKTLEEELTQAFDWQSVYTEKTPTKERLLAFISSREEKAREEGWKEGYKQGYDDTYSVGVEDGYNQALLASGDKIRTQYKEELLGKLPEEYTPDELVDSDYPGDQYFKIGFNECLSEIKKLIK